MKLPRLISSYVYLLFATSILLISALFPQKTAVAQDNKIKPIEEYEIQARNYFLQGKNKLALEAINKAVRFYPNDANTYHSRGLLFLEMGKYQLASAEFSKAINIKPNEISFYVNRSISFVFQENIVLARRDLAKAKQLSLSQNAGNEILTEIQSRLELLEFFKDPAFREFIITFRDEFNSFFAVMSIPAESMEPTLPVSSTILIDRMSFIDRAPQRKDLVIFAPTEILREKNYRAPFLQRIIGLPGETIEIKNGKVYINNNPLEEDYISEPPDYEYEKIKVPANSYFVLGDNRNNSYDSHYWGFVPRKNILAKVTGIICPADKKVIFDPEISLNKDKKELLSKTPILCKINML